MYLYFILSLVLSCVLTVVAERILIPILKSVKMEQKILDIGPRWHKSKEGTPTMGGIGFIISTVVASALFIRDMRGDHGKTRLLCRRL